MTKKLKQKKPALKPEELRVKAAEFDAFMRKALSAPPPPKETPKHKKRASHAGQ